MLAWCGVMLVIVRCNEPTVLFSLSLSINHRLVAQPRAPAA